MSVSEQEIPQGAAEEDENDVGDDVIDAFSTTGGSQRFQEVMFENFPGCSYY